MTSPADLVARAFGLGRPAGQLVEWSHSTSRTWMLDTADGRVLVKQVTCDGWRDQFERAMVFEELARSSGISMPRPIAPTSPAFGCVTDVPGLGLLRAYEWVGGRALIAGDDVADWLGATLAALHRIQALAHAEPQVYGLHDRAQWQRWLDEGTAQGRVWAPMLARRLPEILDTIAWIGEAFRVTGGYVMTHRDVEPWNVILTGQGPVLVDWDTAGPDSAGLETAHAAIAFASHGRHTPDPQVARAIAAAYTRHGGRLPMVRDALARRAGMRLNRLAERLQTSIGRQPAGPRDIDDLDATSYLRLEQWPAFLADLANWSRWLVADLSSDPMGRP
jgi:Ser/Thr protein kinase RdoA (MazF antagonist)